MAKAVPSAEELNEAYNQLKYLQSIYSQQYEILENEIATFTLSINSIQRNMQLLENANRLEGAKILINGEGGTYIEAGINSVKKVITYIGAGYLVEKDVEDAKSFLIGNEKKQEESLKRLAAERQKIEKELVEIALKLSSFRQQ